MTMRALWRTPVLGPLTFYLWGLDAKRKRDWIAPHLAPGASLLEIGSGPGGVVAVLREAGHAVTAVDVTDTSYHDDLQPILYDGRRLPFADNAFDAALVLTTLHHARDPDAVLAEAARAARRVCVIEDIYRGPLQRRLTKLADSITNLEFWGHPHANRDDAGWRETFDRMGLTLRHAGAKPIAGVFLQALYVLDTPTAVAGSGHSAPAGSPGSSL